LTPTLGLRPSPPTTLDGTRGTVEMRMDQDALKQELAEICRKLWIAGNEKRSRIIAMSEDEYLAKREKHWQEKTPSFKQGFPFDRDAVLRFKRRLKPETAEFIERMVAEQVEQAFPFLVENRELSGVTGPVTEVEARIASLTHQYFGPNSLSSLMKRGPTDHLSSERVSELTDWLESEEWGRAEVDTLRRDPTQENLDRFLEEQEARAVAELQRREESAE